jgi:hypothetical protein
MLMRGAVGIGQGPQGSTSDGVPNHYGVNNLSHFVITNRLIPLMLATAKHAPPTSVRIVMQSSEACHPPSATILTH